VGADGSWVDGAFDGSDPELSGAEVPGAAGSDAEGWADGGDGGDVGEAGASPEGG